MRTNYPLNLDFHRVHYFYATTDFDALLSRIAGWRSENGGEVVSVNINYMYLDELKDSGYDATVIYIPEEIF